MAFASMICRKQVEQGRYFVFEHPRGAMTWQLNMVKLVLEIEGVRLARFDICMFGMKTTDEVGNVAYAKKQTAVMTNSVCIAWEITKKGQCQGDHRHAPLIGGRAKA